MSMKKVYDVIVIGGGAAGMMAAGRAAQRGLSVLLIEKNSVLGKKLSISGGGRCNITNAEFDIQALLTHYGNAKPFLHSPFSQFSPKDTFSFFEKRGLPLVIEDRKRAFPETHKASDVAKVMEQYVRASGVEVILNTAVKSLEMSQNSISGVYTDKGVFTANTFILASGGRSHPETGSTGEGFGWLYNVGHTTHASNPNLVPLIVSEKWVEKIAGTVLSDARVTFGSGGTKIVKNGNVLVTHFGLSGPTILNSAYEVQQLLKNGAVPAKIDLFPKEDVGALRSRFQKLSEEHGNKTLSNALREWFSAGVVEAILATHGNVGIEKMHSLNKDTRHSIVDRTKGIEFTVTGVKGFDWAVVSDGGVDLAEIDTRTMRSRVHKNLYIIGDMLHVNRPSGGYSLQLCWTTGWVAGNSVEKNDLLI
jgi:predicted Rossmann fold flavoprotein